jgi:hypothetical protein
MLSSLVVRRITHSAGKTSRQLCSLMLVLAMVGCASSGTVRQVDRLETVSGNPRILIMNPNSKYYLLTAGGVTQPQAEWTESARINFSRSLNDYASEHNVDVVTIDSDDSLTDIEISYQKLYSAVGSSILTHHYGVLKLPTKEKNFDWSLGPGVEVIGKKYNADYALFSYYRDYQASGGRIAFSFFAALVGVGIAPGGEIGFASLVDLRTGDIVWFNKVSSGVGELREAESARQTVEALFKDMPVD